MKLTKEKLTVIGMHCSGCVERVSSVLNDLEGVRSAEVSLDEGRAIITYDEDQTGFSRMKEAIEKAGYQAEQQ